MSENIYVLTSDGELYHYGVVGMKWGVRKSAKLSSKNDRLERKSFKYDAKSAMLTKKSENAHASKDLKTSNRSAKKAAKYIKKAANTRRRALDGDDADQLKAETKATNLEYKAAVRQAKANRISKTTGYGLKAMKYAVKSDNVAIKAARARSKIASNKAYIDMMNRRMDSLDSETLRKVETPFSQQIRESIAKHRSDE